MKLLFRLFFRRSITCFFGQSYGNLYLTQPKKPLTKTQFMVQRSSLGLKLNSAFTTPVIYLH